MNSVLAVAKDLADNLDEASNAARHIVRRLETDAPVGAGERLYTRAELDAEVTAHKCTRRHFDDATKVEQAFAEENVMLTEHLRASRETGAQLAALVERRDREVVGIRATLSLVTKDRNDALDRERGLQCRLNALHSLAKISLEKLAETGVRP